MRLHHQRLGLVRLQSSQRLGRAADALFGDELLLDAALDRGHECVEVELVACDRLHPRAPDRHRLVADDDLEPCDLGRAIHGVDPPDEDLQRALVGVERVVVTQRGLTGDAQQRPFVTSDDLGYARMRLIGECVDPCDSQRRYPSGYDSKFTIGATLAVGSSTI